MTKKNKRNKKVKSNLHEIKLLGQLLHVLMHIFELFS